MLPRYIFCDDKILENFRSQKQLILCENTATTGVKHDNSSAVNMVLHNTWNMGQGMRSFLFSACLFWLQHIMFQQEYQK